MNDLALTGARVSVSRLTQCENRGYSFITVKGLRFQYVVNGNEIQINRKKKSVTRRID